MIAIKEKAYAKINLFLDVCAKRPDGFHEIKTVMHTVSLCDDVTVFYTPSDRTNIRVSVDGNKFLPQDSRNLAYAAAQLYLDRCALSANIDIKLKKRIPVAAGLAGGSSDAAAVLRALNKVNKRLLTDKALSELSSELGSDVPYCLMGKTALCEGRGEKMTRLPDVSIGYAVIAIAGEFVSTPKAYGALDAVFSDFDGSEPTGGDEKYPVLKSAIDIGRLDVNGLFNVFERAVLPECPKATSIKAELLTLGAKAAMMSGSGPSVFGIFDTLSKAEAAANILSQKGITATVACSV